MSSDRETGRRSSYRPLGYDLRLTGPRADADRLVAELTPPGGNRPDEDAEEEA